MIRKILSPAQSAILFLLLISLELQSQTTFVRRAGSTQSDFGLSCSPTYDDGIIVAQENSLNGLEIFSGLVKTDSAGIMQWNKLYQIGDYTIPYTVLQAKDEGYIVYASASDSAYVNNNKHFLVLYKTDNLGNTQWNKQYTMTDNDIPLNLVHRRAGGYISFSIGDYNLGGYPKTGVTVYDDNGVVAWSKQFSAQYGLHGVRGIEMPDSNICFIATAGDPAASFFLNVVVTMLDASGNFLWSKNFGTYYDDEPYALAANSSNEIFITGRNYFINRNWDSFLLKLDHLGNKLLSKVYDGGTSNGEIMRCILAFDDGTCKLLGDMGTFDERDITLINIDSNASVASARRYTFSPMFTNYPYDIFEASDGGLVFTGDYRPPSAYRDAIIVKTEADGSLPCFMTTPTITEYNETFHDTIFTLTNPTSTVTQLNFIATIPVNPIYDHTVCALSTDISDPVIQNELIENIFPNPASDRFILKTNSQEKLNEIRIFSTDGRTVYSRRVGDRGSSHEIEIENLTAGLYMIECVFERNVGRKTILKY